MHKIDKFLARLTTEQREKVLAILAHLKKGDISGLDVRKLQGVPNLYRIRVGKMRIVFYMTGLEVRILSIGNRREDTYRDL